MAAEVGQRFTGWSYLDLPYNDQRTQDASVQQMLLDHGSISFGRFATESLSWEKRSVFAHNRRQEELRKLTLPGLVAQKKAFFEEYYKRARTLKAQEVTPQTDVALELRSHDDTLGQCSQENQTSAVISEDLVASAPSSSLEPSAEVSLLDEKKCQEPRELGYLTYNPLFSQTRLRNAQQEEGSTCAREQDLDGEFACGTHAGSRHVLNHDTFQSKMLAPKHVVSADYGAGSRIVLPTASLQSEGSKFNCLEKQELRKNIGSINRSTKISKEPSASLIHVPRIDSRRNSENKTSQDLKDLFHKRVEMKLRALSDRMSADRVAISSRSALYQNAGRVVTSLRSPSYHNADRVATSSRSASCQNARGVVTSSRSAALASHRSPKEVERAATRPHAIFFGTGSRVSCASSSNTSATGKVAVKGPMMPNSTQVNGKNFGTAQATLKKAASLTSVSNGAQNKRKQAITPVPSDNNSMNRRYVYTPAPTAARSRSDNVVSRKTAKAPKVSYERNAAKTEVKPKTTYQGHLVGRRNSVPKHTVNCNEENRKVVSSQAGNLSSGKRSNLTCGLSLSKSKPRQERPRWR